MSGIGDPGGIWEGARQRMNRSVDDRNAALEKQGGLRWDHEQRLMSQQLEGFGEDRRRFDERINLLRGLFGGIGGDGGYAPMPTVQQQPSAAQAGFGMVSGGSGSPSFNDGMDRKKIQNMLQMYLSQRLGG